jgi:hypothetical protein
MRRIPSRVRCQPVTGVEQWTGIHGVAGPLVRTPQPLTVRHLAEYAPCRTRQIDARS